MNDTLVVFVTVASRRDGEEIAELLVGERLAACVNVLGPVRSVYRWQGEVRREDEHLLVIKTVRERFAELQAHVLRAHSYEVPEILALAVEAGLSAYLDWIVAATGVAGGDVEPTGGGEGSGGAQPPPGSG